MPLDNLSELGRRKPPGFGGASFPLELALEPSMPDNPYASPMGYLKQPRMKPGMTQQASPLERELLRMAVSGR